MKSYLILLLCIWLSGCIPSFAEVTGWATYYTLESCRREGTSGIMANGKPLDERALTCALPWKPDGRKYRVSNSRNGSSVVVTHTDYGPAAWTGNIIDLTPAAFRKLGRLGKGKIRVEVKGL